MTAFSLENVVYSSRKMICIYRRRYFLLLREEAKKRQLPPLKLYGSIRLKNSSKAAMVDIVSTAVTGRLEAENGDNSCQFQRPHIYLSVIFYDTRNLPSGHITSH